MILRPNEYEDTKACMDSLQAVSPRVLQGTPDFMFRLGAGASEVLQLAWDREEIGPQAGIIFDVMTKAKDAARLATGIMLVMPSASLSSERFKDVKSDVRTLVRVKRGLEDKFDWLGKYPLPLDEKDRVAEARLKVGRNFDDKTRLRTVEKLKDNAWFAEGEVGVSAVAQASREHCVIEVSTGVENYRERLGIQDLNSSNGTQMSVWVIRGFNSKARII